MLNTNKLLYILPDVAYVAELLPGKKPHTFTVQTFRQINGEFIDDNEFIADHAMKLINKLEPGEYHLLLPDFLFTNTILNIAEKSDAKIKHYLQEKLLPSLDLHSDTHEIDTTVLTDHGNTSKVQLSALEKSLLLPLQLAVKNSEVKITAISPLSWSIKSLISLEPSISVVQIGSMLYIAEHYIGVDQASQAPVEEVESIYETIKTLKGGEPSIQTVYLLSNELVEEQLKEHLSNTIPIQQLSGPEDDENKLPTYVRAAIEAAMRTLSIPDYPVPRFNLGKAPAGASLPAMASAQSSTDEDAVDETTITDSNETDAGSKLPKPRSLQADIDAENTPVPVTPQPVVEFTSLDHSPSSQKSPSPSETKTEPETETDSEIKAETKSEPELVTTNQEEDDQIEALLSSLKTDEPAVVKESQPEAPKTATAIATPTPQQDTVVQRVEKSTPTEPVVQTSTTKHVIKNKNRTNTLLKMVFVTLAVFFATVGVGVGIGLGVISLTQNNQDPISPLATATPSPVSVASPTPSPSPSPSPTVDKATTKLLVVNATTIPGHAGKTKTALEKAGFTSVAAGNAKGDYEKGMYILISEQNGALQQEIEEATGLVLTFQDSVADEDPNGLYAAVVVLAE